MTNSGFLPTQKRKKISSAPSLSLRPMLVMQCCPRAEASRAHRHRQGVNCLRLVAVRVIMQGRLCKGSSPACSWEYRNVSGETRQEWKQGWTRAAPKMSLTRTGSTSVSGTPQAGVPAHPCTTSLKHFPCQVPSAEPGRGMEPLSPGRVLFTACSASSPQGTETARPYETVAMNI